MTDNVQGLHGEYRRFNATEIGGLIRMLREKQGIKQAVLAADADVSVKTIERAESGQGISEEYCRRIAKALGLQPDSFTRELFIPTAEEAARYQEQQEAERKRDHSAVVVNELKGVRDVLSLFGGYAMYADDQCVAEQHLHQFAELKENFNEWGSVADDCTAPQRVAAAEELLTQIREFETLGYVMKGGTMERYLVGLPNGAQPAKFPVTILVAFKKPKGSKDTTPTEVWLPKKMPMGL